MAKQIKITKTAIQVIPVESRIATSASATDTPHMRVILVGECKSLNQRSTLSYHVGVDTKNDPHIRLSGNDGGGVFTPCWVSLKSVHAVFVNASHVPLSSKDLFPSRCNLSANNFGFWTAVLLHLGLIERAKDSPKQFVMTDGKAFMAELSRLLSAGTDIKVVEPNRNPVAVARGSKAGANQKTEHSSTAIPASIALPGSLQPA